MVEAVAREDDLKKRDAEVDDLKTRDAEVVDGSVLSRFRQRFVGDATPGALGAIRIVTCAIALAIAFCEDLPSAARMPLELRGRMGLLEFFYSLPIGFRALVTSEAALWALLASTVLTLLSSMVGYRTRISLPLAALGYFLLGGILRQYSRFFHTGLIPLYVLVILCFTPCADGYSLDAARRRRRGLPVPDPALEAAAYGWSRYACWLVIALSYVFAALSKLRAGPPMWWGAENFKRIVLGTNVKPMQFDIDLGLAIQHWPNWGWSVMGFAAVATELAYGSVLFSKAARRIMPPLTAALHVGILLFQNILFLDMILLQLVFFDFERRLRPSRGTAPRLAGCRPWRGDTLAAAVLAAMTVSWAGFWAGKREYYPFTSMQMFAGKTNRSTKVGYQLVFARRRSGEVFEARLDEALPVLRDTRYREYLSVFGKSPKRQEKTRTLLDMAAAVWNEDVPAGSEVVEFEIQDRVWNFATAADDPNRGKIVGRFHHDVRPRLSR